MISNTEIHIIFSWASGCFSLLFTFCFVQVLVIYFVTES